MAQTDDADARQTGGARAFWSGTITFGLVSVPVDLYPAIRSSRLPLRMLGPDDQPLERRYFCSADGEPLTNDNIVRGYEWDDGSFTLVTDEELDALAPEKSRDIDLRRFVPRDQIPAELLERPYVLAPAGESTKAYHLLAETMERTHRAGIATFVMRDKEYLAAIFAEGGLLRALTMRFIDELRTPEWVGLPEPHTPSAEARKRVAKALKKLEKNSLALEDLKDEYSASLRQLAEKKRAHGTDVVEVQEAPEAEEESADVIDIMSVLKQRMTSMQGESGRATQARPHTKMRPGHERSSKELERKSKKELYAQAKKLAVPNRSRLSKEALIDAIRKAS